MDKIIMQLEGLVTKAKDVKVKFDDPKVTKDVVCDDLLALRDNLLQTDRDIGELFGKVTV